MSYGFKNKSAVALFIAIFALSIFRIADYDFWFHLATGKLILAEWRIPYTDLFSYTFFGKPWVVYGWLSDVIFYLTYLASGINGLIILRAFLAVCIFWVVFHTIEKDGANRILALVLCFAAFWISMFRLHMRPHIFSFLFVALYIYLLRSYEYSKNKRLLFWLVPLQVLWVNLHGGSALLGVLFAGIYLIDAFLRKDINAQKLFAALVAALFTASFINPNLYKALTYGGEILREQAFRRYISETWPSTRYFSAFYPYWIMLAVGALSFLFAGTRRFVDMVLYAIFAYMSISAMRFQAEFAIVAAPIIARNLSPVIANLAAGKVKQSSSRRLSLSPYGEASYSRRRDCFVAALLAMTLLAFTFNMMQARGTWARYGFGIEDRIYPVKAVEFIKEKGIKGNMFNASFFGGYLIWHLYPERKVFIDGRADVFGPKLLTDEFTSFKPEVWSRLEAEHKLDYVLLQNVSTYLYANLDSLTDWRMVYFDDNSLLYVKRNGKNDAVIDKYAYKLLKPNNPDLSYLDAAAIPELKRSIAANLNCLLSYTSLAYIYTKLEDYDNAISNLKECTRIAPYQSEFYARLGLVCQRMNNLEEAEANYKKAIKYNSRDASTHNNLGIVSYLKKDLPNAIRHIRKAARLDPNNPAYQENLRRVSGR